MTDEEKKAPGEMELDISGESGGSDGDKGVWEKWKAFPKSVFPIFGNEFCERFSYYGMRTILTLYVVNVLGFSDQDSVAMFHGFIVVCYTSPLAGSILADGYIGKYHTILWVSLFYACGNVILAVASSFDKGHPVHPGLDFVGLLIIGLGTGGIKPCVSAFGGDQFRRGQEYMIEAFFSIFYFSINAGALISTFISPILRVQQCLNQPTCFPAAFGLPAGLMVVAVVVFVIGTPFYRQVPPKENVIGIVARSIAHAVRNKRQSSEPKENWMEHYLNDHVCDNDPKCTKEKCDKVQLVKDIRVFLRVCVMYVPVPIFWALYDQQGSTWVLQAVLMDGRIGSAELLPDQMNIFNSVLILVFIPIFQGLIYPACRKVGIDPTPLRRMIAGGFLAAVSFLIAMFVQLAVQTTAPVIPSKGTFSLTFINTFPCNVSVSPISGGPIASKFSFHNIPFNRSQTLGNIPTGHGTAAAATYRWNVTGSCVGPTTAGFQATTNITSDRNHFISVLGGGFQGQKYLSNTLKASLQKAQTGEGQFKLSLTNYLTSSNITGYMFWCRCRSDVNYDCTKVTKCTPFYKDYFASMAIRPMSSSGFKELKPGYWALFRYNQTGMNALNWKKHPRTVLHAPIDIVPMNLWFQIGLQGGIYSMVISNNGVNGTIMKTNYVIAAENKLNILIQVPQYVVITAAEILFSITGLEFSYSQAPVSMKSCVQAVWLLTTAFGDLIDVIIALANPITNVAYEMLLFAVLMTVVIIVFMLMSIYWYEYTFYENTDEDDDENDTDKDDDDGDK